MKPKHAPYYGPLNEAVVQLKAGNLSGAWMYMNMYRESHALDEFTRPIAAEIDARYAAAPRVEYAKL